MAYKTRVTTTLSVPCIAGWRCSKCNAANISQAVIRNSVDTIAMTHYNTAKIDKAYEQGKNELKASWKINTMNLILSPQTNLRALRYSLFLSSPRCMACGHKELWTIHNTAFIKIVIVSVAVMLFSLLFVITDSYKIENWIAFLVPALILIFTICGERFIRFRLEHASNEIFPYIISLNNELEEYALQHGYDISSFNEIERFVKVYGNGMSMEDFLVHYFNLKKPKYASSEHKPDVVSDPSPSIIRNEKKIQYCRKCGVSISAADKICSNCGIKL